MRLLLDSDHITYRCSASCEPTKIKPYLESREDALLRADGMMEEILRAFDYPEYESYIGGEGNWRYAIYPEYKANRKDMKRPTWLQDVREHLVVNWKAQIINNIEVDDMCGIRLTEEGLDGVCVSLDKDLLTVPGIHYNFVKKEMQFVTPNDALRYFYKQVITGDASDNIPAFDGKLRSSLPKFVAKLLEPIDSLDTEGEMYAYTLCVYEDFYGNLLSNHAQEMMHRNAKVLYIQKQEGDKWSGPKEDEEPLL